MRVSFSAGVKAMFAMDIAIISRQRSSSAHVQGGSNPIQVGLPIE